MRTEITTRQIFEENKILTLEIAKTLIGKTLAVTNAEDGANTYDVRVFKLLGIQTQYDEAAFENTSFGLSLQELWHKENNNRSIDWAKNRIKLQYEGDNPFATYEIGNRCLPEGTFFGSDADREIYFIVL